MIPARKLPVKICHLGRSLPKARYSVHIKRQATRLCDRAELKYRMVTVFATATHRAATPHQHSPYPADDQEQSQDCQTADNNGKETPRPQAGGEQLLYPSIDQVGEGCFLCPKTVILEGGINTPGEVQPLEQVDALINNRPLGKGVLECPQEINQESQESKQPRELFLDKDDCFAVFQDFSGH